MVFKYVLFLSQNSGQGPETLENKHFGADIHDPKAPLRNAQVLHTHVDSQAGKLKLLKTANSHAAVGNTLGVEVVNEDTLDSNMQPATICHDGSTSDTEIVSVTSSSSDKDV